jgi:hypothetical protein
VSQGKKIKISVDVNKKIRDQLEQARSKSAFSSPGHVIANLSFGFWRYLSSSAHEISLWRPYLHHAFLPGTSRKFVDSRVGDLHYVRNRIAHHESLLREDISHISKRLHELAGVISPHLSQYISMKSTVNNILKEKP